MSGYLGKKGVYISATEVGTESSPTYTGLTLSGGTASTLAYLNASKAFTSLANGTGYLYNNGSGALAWQAVDTTPFWRIDGTSTPSAAWDLGDYGFTALNLTADPTLGAEAITFDGTYGSGGNWAWSTDRWTHTAGVATALTSTWTPAATTTYKVVVTTAGRTAGSLSIAIGGVLICTIDSNITGRIFHLTTLTTAAIIATPSYDFNGSITGLSVKTVTGGKYSGDIDTYALNLESSDPQFNGDKIDYAYGYQAMKGHTGVYGNAFGYQALYGNTGALNCNGFGYQALYNNSGTDCSAFGSYTMLANTGANSSGFGERALQYQTGAGASGLGIYALSYNTGGYSTAIGYQALKNNLGAYSTAIGANAGLDNIAANVIAVGREALAQNTGADNIEIGFYGTSGINKIQLLAGTWAAATSGGGATVEASRKYRVAAVIDGAETELSTTITGTGAAGAQYDHTNVPVYSGPKTCTARKIYRYKSADKKWYLVGSINDNSTATYTDTQATASYGTVSAGPTNAIAIGNEAKVLASNDAVIGDSSKPISRLYLGGVYHATSGQAGLDFTIKGMGGNGTDKAGAKVVISSGAGTGTAGSILELQSSTPSTTGSAENVPTTKLALDGTGFTAETFKITAGTGAGLTVNSAGNVNRQVYKVTVTYDGFSAAALTADHTIATLPAKTKIVGFYADTTTPFTGGGVTAAALTVGKSAGGVEYIATHDVLSAAITRGLVDADMGTELTRAAAIQGGAVVDWVNTTTVSARLTTVTANTNALTAGSTTFYIVTERY